MSNEQFPVASSLGTRIHLSSISSSGSVDMLREAKNRNVSISADVTPHHLFLTEKSILNIIQISKPRPHSERKKTENL